MKKLVILGSTGSIGTQTLDVVRAHPEDFEVLAIAARGVRVELLREQIREFRPKLVAVYDHKAAEELQGLGAEILCGQEGLLTLATMPEADLIVSAMVGMFGTAPTLAAIDAGKNVALANKETLVCAGELMMSHAKARGITLLPVDSEHAAIFQCLQGIGWTQSADPRADAEGKGLKRIYLTASGGPFRGFGEDKLAMVSVKDALKHPNWDMGPKVTIDSASLVNKALELIEARWLFNTLNIEPVIQPTSIVHSMIELCDGTVLAQLGVPDMRLPIEVALMWPMRGRAITKPLLPTECGPIVFEEIKAPFDRPIRVAREALSMGGLAPAAFNAAAELATRRFIAGEIGFLDIYSIIDKGLELYAGLNPGTAGLYSLEDVLSVSEEIQNRI